MGRVRVYATAIGHTKQNAPDSHPNSEVKLLQARVVLGWGTTREGRVLIAFLHTFPCPPSSPSSPLLPRGPYRLGSHGSCSLVSTRPVGGPILGHCMSSMLLPACPYLVHRCVVASVRRPSHNTRAMLHGRVGLTPQSIRAWPVQVLVGHE